MKFGKALETNAEAMPEHWRPYVIRYKALKKKINAIVKELDDRGLPSPIIKDLLAQSMSGDMQRLEYTFDEDKKHLRTSIKVVIDDLESEHAKVALSPVQEEQLTKLLAHELVFLNSSASSSSSDLAHSETSDTGSSNGGEREQPTSLEDLLDDIPTAASETSEDTFATLEIEDAERPDDTEGTADHHDQHKTTLKRDAPLATAGAAADDTSSSPSDRPNETMHGPLNSGTSNLPANAYICSPLSQPPSNTQPPSSPTSSAASTSPLLPSALSTPSPIETLATPGALHELGLASKNADQAIHSSSSSSSSRIHTAEEDGKRVLVIELTADTAFFDQLGEEISQLSKLQESNKHQFESKVEDLSKILTVVSSPTNKDMYTWREILKVYLDAQVFVGDQEADRSTRSSTKAQQQLQWFLKEMERSRLVHKFKQSKSKIAFNTFFQLNSELITMKQFRELNQMAMTKILKKHDKRTNLTASSGFPKHLQNEPFYSDNISKSLTYTIGNQLLTIIPQPDDYSCPICMSVAWKPIRLRCNHVFCVRCLVKAQRKNMIHCPVCRQPNSVSDADASNLDVSMMNFMKLYFPKEIKEKRKETNREQAAEEMEAFTGQRWSEIPDTACTIM
ncbi:hypothetical protein BGZ99_008906 [Dissophora globulifera]|uniref:SPX domain-containing protein n=1 Tax=Dissophora globulifera TaxID=979702 RepID=A0A9P6UNY7_9FUNG|nr:hypothetical protein BGZ99_008906 [Dissophora globulifera]